ncbi:MAG: hypothetical protein V1875_05460 [Candidatus Altiarchaeota archaeon]
MAGVAARYRREPKSLDDFREKFKGQMSLLDGINPLGIGFPPELESQTGIFYPKDFIERVCLILEKNKGKKVHFLMPMTGQQATGEFMKGVLKVLSPEGGVALTFLKTPYRVLLNLYADGVPGFESANESLRLNLEEALRKHGAKKEDTEFVVLDKWGSGTTFRSIRDNLGVSIDFYNTNNLGAGIADEFHLTKDKTKDGIINVSRGELLELILKQNPENPKISQDDFSRDGFRLIDALKGHFLRYFTEEERKGIDMSSDFELWGGGRHTKDGWPKIIDHIRRLPEESQKRIIKRLKKDDNMLARMAYQYGIARAKKYVQDGNRPGF